MFVCLHVCVWSHLRPSDHEASAGLQVVDGLVIQILSRDHCFDHLPQTTRRFTSQLITYDNVCWGVRGFKHVSFHLHYSCDPSISYPVGAVPHLMFGKCYLEFICNLLFFGPNSNSNHIIVVEKHTMCKCIEMWALVLCWTNKLIEQLCLVFNVYINV